MHPNFFDGNMHIINQTGLLNKMIPLLEVVGGWCHRGPHIPRTKCLELGTQPRHL